ncbi:hypothetical protein [Rhodanobacter sp. BL-MT-08]
MVFRTRKAAVIAGILVVAMGWVIKAPLLVHWADIGAITLISFILLFAATVSLLAGALAVQLGKRGRVPFALHILFAVLALYFLHSMFLLPLALGVVVAATAIFWPVAIQTSVSTSGSGPESV